MALERIMTLLAGCSTENTRLPPTILYNEGWMLRLVMHWFAGHPDVAHPLGVPSNCHWYSEALLPSTFLQRYRGDKFAEAWTHADGAIGHFVIGRGEAGDLSLNSEATHFVVIEAKMFSKLSSGITHARYYNQAARNVACIAEAQRRVGRKPSLFNSLGFYVVAPASQIKAGIFRRNMNTESIQATVQRRVNEYDESNDKWFIDWFLPTIEAIDIQTMSWEEIIEGIDVTDQRTANELKSFYDLCLKYNRQAIDKIKISRKNSESVNF